MNNTSAESHTLQQAYEAWNVMARLRSRRSRYKNYTYGRQWEDPVEFDGHTITEGEYARLSGKKPMTNNLIRQLVKSVVGRFRHMLDENGSDVVDREVRTRNMLDELDCRQLEEFLISGCAIQRITRERRPAGSGIWVDNISPDRFFCNRFTDPRGNDLELVGMLHDMSLREVQMRFGGGTEAGCSRLARIYDNVAQYRWTLRPGEDVDPEFSIAPPGRCRVIEVWTLESHRLLKCHDLRNAEMFTVAPAEAEAVNALNRRRTEAGEPPLNTRPASVLRWVGRWYAPSGELLSTQLSPYPHGEHPFAVKFYPLIDGEVHSFVEDVIDSQRYVNRLITLIDHIMGVSAKGVLLFPEGQKPESMSWQDVALRWANPNGILPYRPDNSGQKPHQIINGTAPGSAYELLGLELKLIQQISGVSGALAGQIEGTGQSAALYEAQSNNATIALLDIFESFNSFRQLRNKKLCLL